MSKFLIIRFSSIGDIILTSPVVRNLKTQFPNAEVHFVTKKNYQSLLSNNPYVDKCFVLENSLNKLVDELKNENYDYIIDLHNNLRTSIIKLKLGKKSFSFDKLNLKKWLMVRFKKNLLPNVHIVDRYMATVSKLGIQNDNKGLDYFISKNTVFPEILNQNANFNQYVVYAIGGQHETKKLPFHKMLELCQSINQPLVLIGGKEDKQLGEKVVEYFGKTNKAIINLCGQCSIDQSALVIQNSSVVYTHDTGMMHIAAALKKSIVAIWGNTIPEFGMYPYQTSYVSLENKDINCRPCSKIGFTKCPKGHFDCMNQINFKKFDFPVQSF